MDKHEVKTRQPMIQKSSVNWLTMVPQETNLTHSCLYYFDLSCVSLVTTLLTPIIKIKLFLMYNVLRREIILDMRHKTKQK